jgi:two-component system, chemotaxis family, CheB/CheR fusion protein
MTAAERNGEFEELLEFIRTERGFDFTGYKRPTLMRRIDKHMQEAGIDGYSAYREYLEHHAAAFGDLFNTILINVTSFFRDDVAWKFLADEIVPRIVQGREGEGIRIWSTGCATGEEAYSLAIIFAQALGDDEFRRRVKIYATDVDDDALKTGRHARYTTKHMTPVPTELRDVYFEQTNGSWSFRPDLRRPVIFGRHDLVQDPPISRIDLLVARNTLMYFDTPTQEQILQNFHFALRDDGYLFLGKAEALAARTSFFAPIDLKRRIFAKVPRAIRKPRLVPLPDTVPAFAARPEHDVVRDAALDGVPVAQLTVGVHGELLVANLQARALFGLGQRDIGRPFKDLEISFRPVELRSRIDQVLAEGHPTSLREVEWPTGTDKRYVDVQISALVSPTGETVGVGISFADATRYRRLQEELQESRREGEIAYEELQSTNEELETTNEELQSTNEELETTNEELQSTNEELETTNEELQSTNVELQTINDELNMRSDDLNQTNAFLDAVLGSLDAGVAVVDRELEVQAWNRGARELWGLAADETVGRHFLGLDIGLPLDRLRQALRDALAEGDGQPHHLRLEAINRRGRPIDCAVTLTPLRGPSGDGHGLIVMMQTADDLAP